MTDMVDYEVRRQNTEAFHQLEKRLNQSLGAGSTFHVVLASPFTRRAFLFTYHDQNLMVQEKQGHRWMLVPTARFDTDMQQTWQTAARAAKETNGTKHE